MFLATKNNPKIVEQPKRKNKSLLSFLIEKKDNKTIGKKVTFIMKIYNENRSKVLKSVMFSINS